MIQNIKDDEDIQFSSKLKVKVSYFRLTFKMLKKRREENNKIVYESGQNNFQFWESSEKQLFFFLMTIIPTKSYCVYYSVNK